MLGVMTRLEDLDVMVTRAAGPAGRIVMKRLLSLMIPEAAILWLNGSEPYFGGARPIDVLAIDGSKPVLETLDAFEQGIHT